MGTCANSHCIVQLLCCNFKLAKVVAAGMNPVQVARGIEKTAKALVTELKKMSREVIVFPLLLL